MDDDPDPDPGEDGIDAMVLSLSRCVDIDMIVQVCVVYECVYRRLKRMDVMEERKKEKEKERYAPREKASKKKEFNQGTGGKGHVMYLWAEYVLPKSLYISHVCRCASLFPVQGAWSSS